MSDPRDETFDRDWRSTAAGADAARQLDAWAAARIAEIAGGHFEVAAEELRAWKLDDATTALPEELRRKIQTGVAVALEAIRGMGQRPAIAVSELELIRALVG
jgi:hypothetical protein